jgi:hypothetical protein
MSSLTQRLKSGQAHIKRVLIGLGITLLLLVSAPVLTHWTIRRSMDSEWRRFGASGTNHFAEVAHACDSLLAYVRNSTSDALLDAKGDEQFVPAAIRELKPYHIRVFADQDFVSVQAAAPTRGGFGLVWQPQETDSNLWVLTAGTEFGSRQVWSERRAVRPSGN